jgi:hypothetical protein
MPNLKTASITKTTFTKSSPYEIFFWTYSQHKMAPNNSRVALTHANQST